MVIIIWQGIQHHYMSILFVKLLIVDWLHETADDVAGLRRLYAATRTWLEELDIDLWKSDKWLHIQLLCNEGLFQCQCIQEIDAGLATRRQAYRWPKEAHSIREPFGGFSRDLLRGSGCVCLKCTKRIHHQTIHGRHSHFNKIVILQFLAGLVHAKN